MPSENKMGVMPVNRLLVTMALPMMVSMIIQAMYNIVDSFFVAQISEEALIAVTLFFPIHIVIIGINSGTGVGINALLSKRLGEKKFEEADKVAANAIFLTLIGYLVVLSFGIFCAQLYYETQTDNPQIIELGREYLAITTRFSFGIFFLIVFEKLLQATGRTAYSMICQITGAVLNIFLDWVLIFGNLGLPAMGVRGAALASVIAQCVAAIVALIINLKFNSDIRLKIKNILPYAAIVKRIYKVGAPSAIMDFSGAFMLFTLNNILINFSESAAAVLGVYFRLQSFIYMPVFGMNNGLIPIIAYNYGAGFKKRIKKAIKLAITYAVVIMLSGLAVMSFFAERLLLIFNASPQMLEIGIPALRILSLCYIFAGFNIVSLAVCQALGRGVLSMSASVVRQFLVIIPMSYILTNTLGAAFVWWSFPIAETVTLVLCIIYLKIMYAKINKIRGEKA